MFVKDKLHQGAGKGSLPKLCAPSTGQPTEIHPAPSTPKMANLPKPIPRSAKDLEAVRTIEYDPQQRQGLGPKVSNVRGQC